MRHLLLWLMSSLAVASEGGGPKADKGVQQFSVDQGIRLSDIAVKTLGIASTNVKDGGSQLVPEASLVRYQDKVGVYRLRGGWFKLIDARIVQRSSTDLTIEVKDLKSSDQLVTRGAALLRVAEMEAFSSVE